MRANKPDHFSKKEAQARFEAALKGGLKTPPQPLKTMVGKSKAKQVKRRSKIDASSST